MKKALSFVIVLILFLSVFSLVDPLLVKVGASSPPGIIEDLVSYSSSAGAPYELLLWGNPLINDMPDASVTAFKIYKDGGLLATVDWTTCRYRDYNPVDRWCQYAVSAVNALGEGPQKTWWAWWGNFPYDWYDLTLYCDPPEGGFISGLMKFRSGQTTAGKQMIPAMVTAHPRPGYNFTGQWTSSGSISISYYYPQPICYIDNWWGSAAITGYFQQVPTHDVTISAHCNTEGTDISVPITMDGSPTGYNTPHIFQSLTGTHTFTVPSNDSSGHPFIYWNTGETTTTITVTSGGTYVAYYQSQEYSATIAAHCYKEGVAISVPIIQDGSFTGFSTTHTFTGLVGNHTFTVPSIDTNGHPFEQWNTGQITTTITVSTGATYTAYYAHSYIKIIDVKCMQRSVGFGKNVEVQVIGENMGTNPESRLVEVTLNDRHSEYASLYLSPGQWGSTRVIIPTIGLPSENYCVAVNDEELRASGFSPPALSVLGKPYFIIVAGRVHDNADVYRAVLDDCNYAYKMLTEKVGVDKSQIRYLAPEPQYDANGNLITSTEYESNREDLYWAIKDWAGGKVGRSSPLFLYLHGHGTVDNFWFDTAAGAGGVESSTLAEWLRASKDSRHESIYVVYDGCHSGSFIDDLDSVANATICACKSDQDSHAKFGNWIPPWTQNFHFSANFWSAIGESKSLFDAYKRAYDSIYWRFFPIGVHTQTPVFDDNGRGEEYSGSSIGPNGQGKNLSNTYMGKCEWAFPWVSSTIRTQYFSWPPPTSIPIWAIVRNNTALYNVTVSMFPPDLVPENGTLILESFQMVDIEGDGNFSDQIPSINFTNHASGPSAFRFLLTPRQKDGMIGYTSSIDVIFTEDGQPTIDDVPPSIFVASPHDLDIVAGTVSINGTLNDDVCLQKAELYIDNSFIQSLSLFASSTSYFQFALNTLTLQNGYHNITVHAFDTSNNSYNETIGIWVMTDVHDIAAIHFSTSKTVIAKGLMVNATAIIVNQGTYVENITIKFQANSSVIETKTIQNLPIGEVAELTFNWNTSEAAYGTHFITAFVNALTNETDVWNNAYSLVTVVSTPGDVNGDFTVDREDLVTLTSAYGTTQSLAGWECDCDIDDDKKIDALDLFVLGKNYGSEPGEVVWNRTFGGSAFDYGFSAVQTSDGGYAVGGITNSTGAGGMDFWLVKTDSAGSMLWNRTYGGQYDDWARCLIQTADGGYALAGYTESFGAGWWDAWLVKTDATGNMLWNQTYGGGGDDEAWCVIQTSEGGFALCGSTTSHGNPEGDMWLIKTDAAGNLEWDIAYFGWGFNWAGSVIQTTDGGYALAGATNSSGAGNDDFYLVVTDPIGIPLWMQTYGGPDNEYAYSVVQTEDGGYTLAGYTASFGSGLFDFWLVKTDAFGTVMWNQTYGGTADDVAFTFARANDGGYALAGRTFSFGEGSADSWLVKTDSDGNMLWNATFGGSAWDTTWCIVESNDNGYVLAGYTYSYGVGNADLWLIKVMPL